MLRFVVLVSGGGTNLQAIIDSLKEGSIQNAELCGVISNKPDAYALERAKEYGVPGVCVSRKQYETRQEFEDALLSAVDSFEPDLVVLAGFLVIIPKKMVERYEQKIINIHPSLIPSFCGDGFYGLHVHEEVLRRGVKVTGATVHFVDSGTDTGPILIQKAVGVEPDDTPEVLQKRVMVEAEWQILPRAIHALANDLVATNESGAYYIKSN